MNPFQLLRAEQSQRKRLKQPWEIERPAKLRTLSSVVDQSSFRLGRAESLLADLTERDAAREPAAVDQVKLPVLPYAARKAKLLEWPDESDDLRRRSLHLIRVIVEADFQATKLGSMIYELSGMLSKEPQIQRAIELTFAKKSPATLLKRTMAFWKLFKYHAERDYKSGLAMTECSIFVYLDELRNKAAPTALQSCLESIFFFHTLLGVKQPIDDLVSHRIRGLAYNASLNKRPLRQARPLLASEVEWLEKLVLNSLDTAVVCIAGFLLFILANCARFGDAQAATVPTVDHTGSRPVISSDTKRHKLANTAQRKTTLLPLVAFGRLTKDEAWRDPWLKAMKRARLPRAGVDYLLPSWNESTGTFLRRRMTSGEASLHLRELLKQQGKGSVDPPPTSHSLKVTLLSWACKCGEFSLADRQVLGHHLDRPSISALTYGRANFLAPLAKLAKWLELISQGKFRPDDNASAIIAQQLAIEESQSDGHEKSAHGEPEVCDDSASDDMAQDEAEAAAACIVPAPERKVVDGPDQSIHRIHRTSGTLHILHASGQKFLCGRPKTDNYEVPPSKSVYGFPVCFEAGQGP